MLEHRLNIIINEFFPAEKNVFLYNIPFPSHTVKIQLAKVSQINQMADGSAPSDAMLLDVMSTFGLDAKL